MSKQPSLITERLILRPFTLADAPRVQQLAGDPAIAATTLTIPHPYENGVAETWIATHQAEFDQQIGVTFAITLKDTGELAGAISLLDIRTDFQRAELGYWVGKPYWGCGYAPEAATPIIEYGFKQCQLQRIFAHHFADNPASGRVMEKAGMRYEGTLRQHLKKDGRFRDLRVYGILQGNTS